MPQMRQMQLAIQRWTAINVLDKVCFMKKFPNVNFYMSLSIMNTVELLKLFFLLHAVSRNVSISPNLCNYARYHKTLQSLLEQQVCSQCKIDNMQFSQCHEYF